MSLLVWAHKRGGMWRAGAIPASLATAPLIETLDLKGNQLSSLPLEWLEGYPGSANSSFVNVRFSFNKIEVRRVASVSGTHVGPRSDVIVLPRLRGPGVSAA